MARNNGNLCYSYCTCIVVLIVSTTGQVLVLCAAFLCLSDWLILILHTVLFLPLCQLLKLNDDNDDIGK